jgi:hypothetical protein
MPPESGTQARAMPSHGILNDGGRGLPAKAPAGGPDPTGEPVGPRGGVRHLRQRQAALLLEPSCRSPVQAGQDAFAGQHRDRHDTLPLGRHQRQRHGGRPQRDPRVDVQVLAGQPDHRRDQIGQSLAAGIRGVVVDVAGEGGQQRVGAGGVVAPALTSQQRGQFHEAGTRAGAAVLAWRQDREQVGRLNVLLGHAGPQAASGLGPGKSALFPTATPAQAALRLCAPGPCSWPCRQAPSGYLLGCRVISLWCSWPATKKPPADGASDTGELVPQPVSRVVRLLARRPARLSGRKLAKLPAPPGLSAASLTNQTADLPSHRDPPYSRYTQAHCRSTDSALGPPPQFALAITLDPEAAALPSTRNRPRTAVHHGCRPAAEGGKRWGVRLQTFVPR